MKKQTIEAASFAINCVLKDELIQPGDMIQYLKARHHNLMCAGLDLKNEMSIIDLGTVEPGFYEKVFAELDAEVEMVKSIIAKLNVDAQPTLEGVIQFLELVQQITTDDIATFSREIESPSSANDSEASQSHTKMLLDEAQHELECLDVVIAKLKWELEGEWEECDPLTPEEMERIVKERPTECAGVDAALARIRKRREELKGEEEYAAKMLDGVHARMELARQMNEQGELK